MAEYNPEMKTWKIIDKMYAYERHTSSNANPVFSKILIDFIGAKGGYGHMSSENGAELVDEMFILMERELNFK